MDSIQKIIRLFLWLTAQHVIFCSVLIREKGRPDIKFLHPVQGDDEAGFDKVEKFRILAKDHR